MREILFRGKRADNGEWVEGYYFYGFELGYNPQGYDDVPPRCHYIFTDNGYFEVVPETVGQYIRTIERNKIFEGDIVKAYKHGNKEEEPYIYEIQWRDSSYWFGNWIFLEFLRIFRYIEIIGDIYDKEANK